MGLYDFNLPKQKPMKIQKLKVAKMRIAKKGDRTLTPADKKKEKLNAKHKCQRCKKSFPARLLDIHHKKGVATYKSKNQIDIGYIEFYERRRKKASYDRSSNLIVLCPTCHRKVHLEESEKKKVKKKIALKREAKKRKLNPFAPSYKF